MGSAQVGGIATLLDIDFNNAAGFIGTNVETYEGMPNFLVYYMSPGFLFCLGTIIEPHVIVTTAGCLLGTRYQFDVVGGTHKFLENIGLHQTVEHVALHAQFNKSFSDCANNVGLMILTTQFQLMSTPNTDSEFMIGRARYGLSMHMTGVPGPDGVPTIKCETYGWGSRRNPFLLPLLLHLKRVHLEVVPQEHCEPMWNCNKKYLCVKKLPCKNRRYGALCPDDLGSPLICEGFLYGIMTSRLLDRPCGIGFLDMTHYHKFLTCGVDDSRVIKSDSGGSKFDLHNTKSPHANLITTYDPHTYTGDSYK